MTSISSELRAQIQWRCRRGMLELDELLQPFFHARFDGLEPALQQAFIELLASEDQDLYDWLVTWRPCEDPRLTLIIRTLLDYAESLCQ